MKRIVIAALLLVVGLSANAQIVGATNSQEPPRLSTNNSSLRQTGSYIRISAGYPDIGTLAYNYQITPWLMAGIGGGFGFLPVVIYHNGYSYNRTSFYMTPSMPVYAEMEFRTPQYKWSIFFNLKLGYYLASGSESHYYSNGDYEEVSKQLVSASTGISYKNLHLGIGYTVQGVINCFFAYSLPLKVIGL